MSDTWAGGEADWRERSKAARVERGSSHPSLWPVFVSPGANNSYYTFKGAEGDRNRDGDRHGDKDESRKDDDEVTDSHVAHKT